MFNHSASAPIPFLLFPRLTSHSLSMRRFHPFFLHSLSCFPSALQSLQSLPIPSILYTPRRSDAVRPFPSSRGKSTCLPFPFDRYSLNSDHSRPNRHIRHLARPFLLSRHDYLPLHGFDLSYVPIFSPTHAFPFIH